MLPKTRRSQENRSPIERITARLLVPLVLGAIALLTLTSSSAVTGSSSGRVACLRCDDLVSLDLILNFLLFVPLGVALSLAGTFWRRSLLLVLLITGGIEVLQLSLVPGRDASLLDVLSNFAGGAVGTFVALHIRRIATPGRAFARYFVVAVFLIWSGTRFGTAWLLRPAFPRTRWYAQLAPREVYPSNFDGKVLLAEIGGESVRDGEMPELYVTLRASGVKVRTVVDGATSTPRLASVLSVLDEHQTEVLVVGQEGLSARLRFRLRAADARLRTPSISLDRAFSASTVGPIELVGFLGPGLISLYRSAPDQYDGAAIALSPGLSWALLLPFDMGLTPRIAQTGTAALATIVLALVGYLVGLSIPGRPVAAAGLSLAIGAIGLWSPAIGFHEATVAGSEALAGTIGAMLGVLAAVAVVRHRTEGHPRTIRE